jgi:hypothetical protein
MAEFDPRIVRLGIEVAGRLKWYEGLAISASGTKYANALENECDIDVYNLSRETRDYLLTETSPYNHNPGRKKVILEAGRASTGAYRIYEGDITEATVSQPPDICLSIKSKTGQYDKGELVARSHPASDLSAIAKGVARDLGLALVFEATDKKIDNYSFTGGKLGQVAKLGQAGGVDAYVDDGTLVVKDSAAPLQGPSCVLSEGTGMVGIPEITEHGVKVTFLLVPGVKLGSSFTLDSSLYKAVNGEYSIYKLSFEISSRDVPFYWVAECRNTKKEMRPKEK